MDDLGETKMTTALATLDNIDRYVAEIQRYPLLARNEEVELALRFRDHGDVSAAHRLVVSNLRFVVKIAHEYKGYGLKLLDVIQEGNVGLMMAVKKFDPDKGFRLISYAVWWIRAYIQAFILRSWSLVKLGTTRAQRKLFFRLRSETEKALKEAGDSTPVTTGDLAERLDVAESEVVDMGRRLAGRDLSLDAAVADGSGKSHLDALESDFEAQDDALARRQEAAMLRDKVAEALETLDERERYIVNNRLMTEEPQTLQEIGDTFQVSRERARQLESRVISKLRKSFGPAATAPQAA
jgi:RNA polymerase sigma-32 factor